MAATDDDAPSSDERSLRGYARAVGGAYRLTGRHFAAMLVPAVIVLVPVGVLRSVSETVLLGRHAVIVNGGLEASGRPGPAFLVWTAFLLLVSLVALGFAVCAITIMAAGRLLGRPSRPVAAMRAAARRWPALAALLLVGLVVAAAILAAVAVVARLGASLTVVVAVGVILSLVALPYATALPAAVLEGEGVLRPLGRAHSVVDGRRIRTGVAVLVGAAMVPGLVGSAGELAASRLAGLPHTLLDQLLGGAVTVLVTPFVAAALVAVFLTGRSGGFGAWDLTKGSGAPIGAASRARLPVADRELIRQRLGRLGAQDGSDRRPAIGSRRRLWTVGLVAATAVPGLVHTGYVWSNPLSLPEVFDHQLIATSGSAPMPPRLLYGPEHRPIAIYDGAYDAAVFGCADVACAEAAGSTVGFPIAGDHVRTGVAALADGRLAVATWTLEQPETGEEAWLRLYACGVTGCPQAGPGSAPVLSRIGFFQDWGLAAAVAVAPGGGIVVAHIDFDRETDESFLYLTTCPDHRCVEARTVRLAAGDNDGGELYLGVLNPAARPLAVAVGPHGAPVVAFLSDWGSVTVFACDSPQCQQPTATRLVEPVRTGPGRDFFDPWSGVDLVVRPDGVPVVAYRDSATGAAQLLVCRSAGCASADNVTLTEPGLHRPPPAIALSRDGQPMIATYDLDDDNDRLVLISCRDRRCADRTALPLGTLQHGPGHLDLGLTADGRPQILRVDTSASAFFNGSASLRLTTCADIGCR